MNNRFGVYTIDALELVYASNADTKKKKKNAAYSIHISSVSGSEDGDKIEVVPSSVTEEIREDCALFYQIRRLSSSPSDSSFNNPDALKEKIIVVDFSGLFAQIDSKDNISEALKKTKKSSSSWINHISGLLDSETGITIAFSDNKTKHTVCFVPFDKSSSMSKRHRITYISKEIKDELNKRILLGMDFNTIPVSLSKYSAYRGLYLTSGIRVDQTPGQFVLNDETVIVVPDLLLHPTDDYNGTPLVYTQKNTKNSKNTLYKFEIRNEKIESNAFDGEGFISPSYAEYIRKQLNNTATSFQVRMPFIKGMLHEVDFHKFLSENSDAYKNGNHTIKDLFGKDRDLEKAQIIINESMFKCHSWIKYYWDHSQNIDKEKYGGKKGLMTFFFAQMHSFDHSLYISGSNASFESDDNDNKELLDSSNNNEDEISCNSSIYEKLNYQFLMTLKLSHKDMQKLMEAHFENSKKELAQYLHPATEAEIKKAKPFIAAASKNPAFFDEPRLIDDAVQQVKNMRIDCGMGSLLTEGEHRYLSADLLAYLWYIANLMEQKEGFDHDKFYKSKAFLHHRFYMPGSRLIEQENKDKEYVLERSPHLSRNEECLMNAYIPDNEESDLYFKYLHHLTGVIMVPVTSLAALICGGADFDGDLLKIYSNKIITNAVKKGGYRYGRRILPVVNIPTAKATEEFPTDDSRFKLLICNTFSGYTGLISNLSVVFASKLYCDSAVSEKYDQTLCARATAIVGLSIDAAKNGGHPMANIKEMKELSKKFFDDNNKNPGEHYIRFKDVLKGIRGSNYKKVGKNIKKDYCTLSVPETTKKITISNPKGSDHSILELPYRFAVMDYEAKDRKFLLENGFIPSNTDPVQKFVFEDEDKSYIKVLKTEGIHRTEALIKDYLRIYRDIRDFRLYLAKKTNSYAKLISLLKLKYDSLDNSIPSANNDPDDTNESIEETLDNTIAFIQKYIDTQKKANHAIKELNNDENSRWLFCAKADRTDRLCEIIGLEDKSVLPHRSELLLTDFTFDGYYILYYIIELIYSVFRDNKSKAERLNQWFSQKSSDCGEYYKQFLDTYKNYSHITQSNDQHSSENGDPGDDTSEEKTFPGQNARTTWKDRINRRAFELLLEIVKSNHPTCKNKKNCEELNQLALQYAYDARSSVDQRGTFFWDVIPKSIILKYIFEGKGDAK